MVSRSLKLASGAAALIALLGTSAGAAEFNLASLAGMTCKGFFVGGSSEMANGAVWLDVSSDGPPTAHYWHKPGKAAAAHFEATQRDALYLDRGVIAFTSQGGKVAFHYTTNGGKAYYWELTPTGTSGEFLIKITGYTFGNEGKLECAR